MKLRNNYNIGDRILILHANVKNQLRKNDIGKIGTIIDKRCSFCIVHLDEDDRNKNYNYGTFGKITKVYVKLDNQNEEIPFNTIEESLDYIKSKFPEYDGTPYVGNVAYEKSIKGWRGNIFNTSSKLNFPQPIAWIRISFDSRLNDKNFDISKDGKTRNLE